MIDLVEVLEILKQYGDVQSTNDVYQLTLKITRDLLNIPEEQFEELPIYQEQWCIKVTLSKGNFMIESSDEPRRHSKDEIEQSKTELSKFSTAAGVVSDGLRIYIEGKLEYALFKESIGRIIGVVRKYLLFQGHLIIGYMLYYKVACTCGFTLNYSNFELRCANVNCGFRIPLITVQDALKNLTSLPDLDSEGLIRKGKKYYLQKSSLKDQYQIAGVDDAESKKWVNGLRKRQDIVPITEPSLYYIGIEFHPLQRGNEDNLPIFLSWVDMSGGATLLNKSDIRNGYSILLRLDQQKKNLQAFKPRFRKNNTLFLEDYNIPIKVPKNVRARMASSIAE